MYKILDKSLYNHLPVDQFDTWAKLNAWKGVHFHMNDYNSYADEVIMWNMMHMGQTNSRLDLRYAGDGFFLVKFNHIGM